MSDPSTMTDVELARCALTCIEELKRREEAGRGRSLEAAQEQWPSLAAALKARGVRLSTIDVSRGPILPEWSNLPVIIGYEGSYHGPKPRSKAACFEIVMQYGDGDWMTMAEAWMFAAGYGPVIESGMHHYGFGGSRPAPDRRAARQRKDAQTISEIANRSEGTP